MPLKSALKGVNLVALFGPEHGIYGNVKAATDIEDSIDQRTSLPVYSLHGKYRKPTKEMLKGLDAMVIDLQDIGTRIRVEQSAGKACQGCCCKLPGCLPPAPTVTWFPLSAPVAILAQEKSARIKRRQAISSVLFFGPHSARVNRPAMVSVNCESASTRSVPLFKEQCRFLI